MPRLVGPHHRSGKSRIFVLKIKYSKPVRILALNLKSTNCTKQSTAENWNRVQNRNDSSDGQIQTGAHKDDSNSGFDAELWPDTGRFWCTYVQIQTSS